MIYTEYEVKFFVNNKSQSPIFEYIENLPKKDKAKVLKYIEFLRENKGVLDEPYSKHIKGKIRELIVDFSKNRHRIFFFTFVNKKIILLHAFLKKTPQTPKSEILTAQNNYSDVLKNPKKYE